MSAKFWSSTVWQECDQIWWRGLFCSYIKIQQCIHKPPWVISVYVPSECHCRQIYTGSRELQAAPSSRLLGPSWKAVRRMCWQDDQSAHLCHLQKWAVLPRVSDTVSYIGRLESAPSPGNLHTICIYCTNSNDGHVKPATSADTPACV